MTKYDLNLVLIQHLKLIFFSLFMFEKPRLRQKNLPRHWLGYSQMIQKPKSWVQATQLTVIIVIGHSKRNLNMLNSRWLPYADMNMYTSCQDSNHSTILYMYKTFQLNCLIYSDLIPFGKFCILKNNCTYFQDELPTIFMIVLYLFSLTG